MNWTWYLFRFDGRINRALLWQALLIVALLAALLGVIGQVIHLIGAEGASKLCLKLDFDFGLDDLFKLADPRTYRSLASLGRTDLILKAFSLALFSWIFLATVIKRLHDRDKSGWWVVAFFIAPGLFRQFSDLLPVSYWMLPFSLAEDALSLWGLVETFCVPGSVGENRFGPDPLAETRDGAAAASANGWDQSRELEFVSPSASPPGGMHVKRGA
ncbi:hypothetical protein A5906_19650 [Bradyrhizobium sacchari]|uniref:Uncharacterized membrane protein YhaH (DUF805 family) n=1 Tax=Bradyrhizobium sacchari TaxID=1399419 RepID=A0A560KKH9_9BRAD|nr:DUF805 domain-containing protein [Bradyrhizobium sacchari]OPZ00408.1 hypothetical protein A5906_19650 [Bradyrhizobium sacchari]TWB64837.1 uncharacterized membrane protein YhaH (DUF805 family) [Bradyrhizobium sacchari]TWB81160.1 uncharacterized membrane protein YhaH (DUF805 family) [Bradyrhizobium sacchari]